MLSFSLIDDVDGRFVVFSDDTIKVRERSLIDYDKDQSHSIWVKISDGDNATEHQMVINVVE